MRFDTRKRAAIQAAGEVGNFLKRRLGKVAEVSYKSDVNLVTDVDKNAERIVIQRVRALFPEDSILSEEFGSDRLTGPFRWIIDPLDGTTNFVRSFPFFCVSIAIEHENDIVFGVIYDPLRDELFHAERGRGAFLNKKRIAVSRVRTLRESFLATGFAYDIKMKSNTNVRNFSKLLQRALAIRRAGSAALDLAYVACGRFDGFWELDLHPWDTAAGSVIVEEAGGKVTTFCGANYTCHEKEVLATNSRIHKQMSLILLQ